MGYDCPQQLFYEARREEYARKDVDAIVQATIDGGHQIGALAQQLYLQSDGDAAVEIKVKDQQQQIIETQQWLANDTVTLFEPTITHGDCLIRVDVLRKRGNKVELIEVKSKSFDSQNNATLVEKSTEYRSYILDIAFQYWVLRQAFPEWEITPYLMLVDKTAVAKQDGLHRLFPLADPTKGAVPKEGIAETLDSTFLKRVCVSNGVAKELENTHVIPGFTGSFVSVVEHLINIYCQSASLSEAPIGSHCKKCRFYTEQPTPNTKSGFHQCWAQHLKDKGSFTIGDTILGFYDPPGRGKRSMRSLIERGWRKLADVEPDAIELPVETNGPLTTPHRQRMQVQSAQSLQPSQAVIPYFDHQGFRKALEETIDNTGWPFYFLDFEGSSSPMPFHAGQRPNAIHLFQFSVHAMYEDGRVEHMQHINLESDPEVNIKMLRDLKAVLGDQGTIFRWHNYENTNLNKIREQLSEMTDPPRDHTDLISFIESITTEKNGTQVIRCGSRNMVDQCQWASQYYFHPDTNGGSGIKKVLPAVMSGSSFLKQKYSQPIYGTDAIPSDNFADHVWWVPQTEDPSKPTDPYDLLGSASESNQAGDDAVLAGYEECEAIQEGGAASVAYIKSQAGALSESELNNMKASLLKYCELDTFAMVMIMEAWLAEIGYWDSK